MNRIGLGLAVGAGYVLGRTKKMKLAFAVGTMVAGKRMQLSPRALADLVSRQLQNNPQFKEIGDQLRGDLRGVGRAATGALIERQIEGLAGRLHGRTSQMRDQLAGVAPDLPGRGGKDREDEYADEADDDEYADTRDEYDEEPEEKTSRRRPAKKAAPKSQGKAAPKSQGRTAAKKAPADKTAAPARKAPARRVTAKKAAPGKAPAKKNARRATGSRATRGGGDDD
ncbi:DNA primase [Streptomyces europaeiscabiei]|uniref:DNA primase n=1 Tax=Streptomyces europaeiscabiei TaxID=146819 RepID=UPI0029AB7746|nr:DNA primase [Streptomyces europaeiscabiei]MDX3776480.1 DNA primase [Streptomyces europaeiscabiei]MDX3842357.1 DNA primase [Streptomyces europaeiscabiei]MDX3860092.1 DNA primase [Streptomyces europaeiscabiei]MDX3869773.1 DNA primase [Streptomyces europaeiscabiei]